MIIASALATNARATSLAALVGAPWGFAPLPPPGGESQHTGHVEKAGHCADVEIRRWT